MTTVKKKYEKPRLRKIRKPSEEAEEAATKKGLTGKAKKAYVGGAVHRAVEEKKGKAPKRAPYTKPALKKYVSVSDLTSNSHYAKLTGSEKQIDYGMSLRGKWLASQKSELGPRRSKAESAGNMKKWESDAEKFEHFVRSHPDAKWWIENVGPKKIVRLL